jgi:hypothetical protein
MDRIRKIGKNRELDLPNNCFRDSYISCRVATKGTAWTAEQAGTSERIIYKHYRELVTKKEAKAWFKIRPTDEIGKVVGFEQ